MITTILHLYMVGIILTGLYITVQLFRELPNDVAHFKEYQEQGYLPEGSSVNWFVVETMLVGTTLSLVFPFFWWLESRRIKNGRY